MKNLIIFLTICSCFSIDHQLFAQADTLQNESPNLRMIGRYIDGKNELRWYPTSAAQWRIGNQNGYWLERMELSDEGSKNGWKKLSNQPIKPLTMAEWNAQTNMDDKYTQVTARAIHELPPRPAQNAKIEEWLEYENIESGVFSFIVISTNMSAEASKGAAMRFEDKTIESGKGYAYRLTMDKVQNPTEKDRALVILEDTKTAYQSPSVAGVRLEEKEGAIRLFWDAPHNNPIFGLYHVERSDNGKQFERITELPIYMGAKDAEEHIFTDSIDNYQRKYYRVVGTTPFGDEGQPSEVVNGMARDFSPAMGATEIKANGNRQSVEITWDLVAESPDLEGFYVGRSIDSEGPFNYLNEKILPPSTRSFSDENPQVLEPFYIVHAIDTAGNISPAFAAMASVFDETPPIAPVNLTGEVDTAGLVTIAWNRNAEADLMGYHVFRANSKNDVYYPLTKYPTRLAEFQDTVTMKALNKEVYYKITALDFNNNPSPYSEILVLKRPDIIPPAAPSIYEYQVLEEKVVLTWHNSSSDDVLRHVLTRQQEGTTEKMEVLTFENNRQKTYTDETVKMGEAYHYFLTAIDEEGNETTSTPLEVSIYDHGRRPAISNFKIQLDKESKTAKLSWTYAEKEGPFRFVIFKAKDENPLISYRSTDSQNTEYQDFIRNEGNYQYAVKVIYEDGGESEISEAVRVDFNGK